MGGGRVHQTAGGVREGATGGNVSDSGDGGREGFDSLLDHRLQYRQHNHHHTDNIFHVLRRIRFLNDRLDIADESGGGHKHFFYRGRVKDGFGGGVVGQVIPAEIVRGVDLSLGFRAATLTGGLSSTSEKPGIVKVIPNRTIVTTPTGNGGTVGGGGDISNSRVINRRRHKITKRYRFKARHDDVEN